MCLGSPARSPATAFNRMAPVWGALGLALTEIEVRPSPGGGSEGICPIYLLAKALLDLLILFLSAMGCQFIGILLYHYCPASPFRYFPPEGDTKASAEGAKCMLRCNTLPDYLPPYPVRGEMPLLNIHLNAGSRLNLPKSSWGCRHKHVVAEV